MQPVEYSQTELSRILLFVVKAIKDAGPSGLSGSRIGNTLCSAFPDFKPKIYGCKTLREFLVANINEIVVVGYTGDDPIYSISDGSTSGKFPVTEGTDFWRIWVSPNSPYVIIVDRPTCGLSSRLHGVETNDNAVIIEPASPDVHRGIALQYLQDVDTVPDSLRDELESILHSSGGRWWDAWINALKEVGPAYLGQWYAFRRLHLETALRDVLISKGFSPEQMLGILDVIRKSRSVKETGQQSSDIMACCERLVSIRVIAQEAVSEMSEAELRQLRVPLGAILDIIARKVQ